MEAVSMKRFDEVKGFLRQGADVNEPDTSIFKGSPLNCLVLFDLLEWVQLFLEKGADPNYTNPARQTPLYAAIIPERGYSPNDNEAERQAARLKIIQLLIANGGDLMIRDNNNERIIDVAGELERGLIKEQLFKNAMYEQLMQPLKRENITHALVWALLMPSISRFIFILNKSNGTSKAFENKDQAKEKSYYLPKELWTKIFSWVLTYELRHKPALLHLLPHQHRHIDTVEKSMHYLLGHQPSLRIPKKSDITAAAQTQLDSEWNELMRPTI